MKKIIWIITGSLFSTGLTLSILSNEPGFSDGKLSLKIIIIFMHSAAIFAAIMFLVTIILGLYGLVSKSYVPVKTSFKIFGITLTLFICSLFFALISPFLLGV